MGWLQVFEDILEPAFTQWVTAQKRSDVLASVKLRFEEAAPQRSVDLSERDSISVRPMHEPTQVSSVLLLLLLSCLWTVKY